MTTLAITLLTATTFAASGLAWWAYCNWRATQSLCREALEIAGIWRARHRTAQSLLSAITAQRQAAARKGWQTRRRA